MGMHSPPQFRFNEIPRVGIAGPISRRGRTAFRTQNTRLSFKAWQNTCCDF